MANNDTISLEDPATVQAGMQLIAENWSPRQQWSGTHLTNEPVDTTIGLRSLIFKDPEPSEEQVHTMLNAAVGPNGYAARVTNDQGEPIVSTQPLWHIEFDSVDDREVFTDRLATFKAAQKGITVDPARLDAAMAVPAAEVSLAR